MRKIHFGGYVQWSALVGAMILGNVGCWSDTFRVADPVPVEEDEDDDSGNDGGSKGTSSGGNEGGSGGQVLDPLEVDDDGDGFSENQGDCDDSTGEISPVAVEVP